MSRMILPTNLNTEEHVPCRIRKRWMSDYGYVDIISPSGRVARVYKHVYTELGMENRRHISELLVKVIINVDKRRNVSENIDGIPGFLDYDLDVSVTDMSQIVSWPVTELFETVKEADQSIPTNIYHV